MAEKSCVLHWIRESGIEGGEIVIILEEITHKNDTYYNVVNLDGHQYIVNHSYLHPLLEGELFNRIKKKIERLKKKVRSLKARNTRLLRHKN